METYIKKIENVAICENMHEPGKYYVKQKKPDTEEQYHLVHYVSFI